MESLNLGAMKEFLGPFGFLLNATFWSGFYEWSRIILAVLGFLFVIASVWIFIKMWPYRPRFYILEGSRAYKSPQAKRDAEEEERIARRKKWDAIVRKAQTSGPRGYPMAIIEADILLEETMGRLGFLGKNLAERLRSSAPGEIKNINDVWEAHKLRNRIAHESDFRISMEETTKILGVYKKALENLGAI